MNLIFNSLFILAFNFIIFTEITFCDEKMSRKTSNKIKSSKKQKKKNRKFDKKQFQEFKKKFKKHYKLTDELYKMQVYEQNLAEIEKLKKIAKKHKNSAIYGITKFSDMSKLQFRNTHLGLNINDIIKNKKSPNGFLTKQTLAPKSLIEIKKSKLKTDRKSFSLLEMGVLFEPTNQANCGGCWAFSSIYVLEAQFALKYGIKKRLSVQEAIDCVSKSYGCNGGNPYWAFKWGKDYGFTLDQTYPYLGVQKTCKYNSYDSRIRVASHWYYQKLDEYTMQDVLEDLGSYSIAINSKGLQNYNSGIIEMDSIECDPKAFDHSVTMVGFGTTEDGQIYWIVKNSWGTDWGENGYFRIAHGTNVCGIAEFMFCSRIA